MMYILEFADYSKSYKKTIVLGAYPTLGHVEEVVLSVTNLFGIPREQRKGSTIDGLTGLRLRENLYLFWFEPKPIEESLKQYLIDTV